MASVFQSRIRLLALSLHIFCTHLHDSIATAYNAERRKRAKIYHKVVDNRHEKLYPETVPQTFSQQTLVGDVKLLDSYAFGSRT